jgi:hypothetical protein
MKREISKEICDILRKIEAGNVDDIAGEVIKKLSNKDFVNDLSGEPSTDDDEADFHARGRVCELVYCLEFLHETCIRRCRVKAAS